MDAELRNKWLEALRSGAYSQSAGSLRKEGGYCCLGVLCDVSSLGSWEEHPGYDFGYIVDDCTERGLLSFHILGVLGFTNKFQLILAQMNDDGLSFNEIADYIEEQL
jgi:hypothetical protein